MKKKIVSTLLTLSTVLFLLALPSFSYASNGNNENTCNPITEIVPWPQSTASNMLPIKARHFEVSVPGDIDNILFINDFLALKYSPEKHFSINPIKKDQIHIIDGSTFGVAEWIKFLFTSDFKEVTPQNKADKTVLRSWVNAKSTYLQKGTVIATSETGSLRYVHVHEKSSISPDSLFILDKAKNTAIAIIFEGFNHTEISNIISTIKLRN